jgi:hypothetical protein
LRSRRTHGRLIIRGERSRHNNAQAQTHAQCLCSGDTHTAVASPAELFKFGVKSC